MRPFPLQSSSRYGFDTTWPLITIPVLKKYFAEIIKMTFYDTKLF